MSGRNLFGIACRTCRRRGRKCDRVLPTCMSCRLRGVECEGYAFRWITVNDAARGTASAAPIQEIGMHPALEVRNPSRRHGARHPRRPARVSEEAELPELNQNVTEFSTLHPEKMESGVIPAKRQRDWGIPMTKGIAHDELGGFVEYCMEPERRTVIHDG